MTDMATVMGIGSTSPTPGGKSRVNRSTKRGHVRELGLGPYPVVNLARAGKKAFGFQQMIADGLDPKNEHEKSHGRSFGDAADAYFDSMKTRWSNEKTRWPLEVTPIRIFASCTKSPNDIPIRCGGHSACSLPGGASPFCYGRDIMPVMVPAFRVGQQINPKDCPTLYARLSAL